MSARPGEFVLVPREPTEQMLAAGMKVRRTGQFYSGHTADESEVVNERHYSRERTVEIFAAMLAAAPAAQPAPSVDEAAVERAAFEAWAASEDYDTERNVVDRYCTHPLNELWEAWQARAALIAANGHGST